MGWAESTRATPSWDTPLKSCKCMHGIALSQRNHTFACSMQSPPCAGKAQPSLYPQNNPSTVATYLNLILMHSCMSSMLNPDASIKCSLDVAVRRDRIFVPQLPSVHVPGIHVSLQFCGAISGQEQHSQPTTSGRQTTVVSIVLN